MSFKVSEVQFVSLCQDVMTKNVVISQQAFFQKISKYLFPGTDPITKNILTENIHKLYTFLTAMSSHPMRVPLSHAMRSTFLDSVNVNDKDITKLLATYNEEYSSESTEIVKSESCPYDVFFKHVLNVDHRPRGVGTVKVVLIHTSGITEHDIVQGVEFKLNIPFKSIRKKMYVDITEESLTKKYADMTVFTNINGKYKFIYVSNADVFDMKSPIGLALTEYYKMWRVKESFLSRMCSNFIQHTAYMYYEYK